MKDTSLETRAIASAALAANGQLTVDELLHIARRSQTRRDWREVAELAAVLTVVLTVIGIFTVLRLKAMGLL